MRMGSICSSICLRNLFVYFKLNSNVSSLSSFNEIHSTIKDSNSPLSIQPDRMYSKVIRDYVNYPFLTNNEFAEWIVNNRFMFIMRGPPGSGKSYITECIRIRFSTAVVSINVVTIVFLLCNYIF